MKKFTNEIIQLFGTWLAAVSFIAIVQYYAPLFFNGQSLLVTNIALLILGVGIVWWARQMKLD
jgi:hypothetical protein